MYERYERSYLRNVQALLALILGWLRFGVLGYHSIDPDHSLAFRSTPFQGQGLDVVGRYHDGSYGKHRLTALWWGGPP
jgi:hypothetical protein